MMGSLYYEVTASGRRVALCVDKHDAEEVARHWYDGQVRELHALVMEDPQPIEGLRVPDVNVAAPCVAPGFMHTYTFQLPPAPTVEAKRKP